MHNIPSLPTQECSCTINHSSSCACRHAWVAIDAEAEGQHHHGQRTEGGPPQHSQTIEGPAESNAERPPPPKDMLSQPSEGIIQTKHMNVWAVAG